MEAVELQRHVDRAMSEYYQRYRDRYGVEPVGASNAAGNTIIKDLVREAGLARCCELIIAYLSTDGDQGWYARKGHTLEEFKRNIAAVNALVGISKPKNKKKSDTNIQINCDCDRCGDTFLFEGSRDLFEKDRLCDVCKMLPPPTLSDFEESLKLIGNDLIADKWRTLVSRRISRAASRTDFGKLCSTVIGLKLSGELILPNWKEYCFTVWIASKLSRDLPD